MGILDELKRKPVPRDPSDVREGAPPRRSHSEQALAAAQHVVDLEAEVTHLRGEAAAWEREAKLAQDRLAQSERELRESAERLDYYKTRNAEIVTRLNVSASIILEALREPGTPSAYAPPHSPATVAIRQAEEEVRAALAESAKGRSPADDGTPPPDFLTTQRERGT